MSLFSPNFPGSWTVRSPAHPATLDPAYQPQGPLAVDNFGLKGESPCSIELQSLNGFEDPPSLAGSSLLSADIFSPEVPHTEATGAVEPHMTGPLLPDSAKLDFSCLLPQAGLDMARAAGPLAGYWVFDPENCTDENVLLHVLSEDFERVVQTALGPAIDPVSPSWRQIIKELTLGLSPEEYHLKYSWAKYTSSGDA